MELLRALGAVIEKPDTSVTRLAALIELPARPTATEHALLFEAQLPPHASRYLSADGARADAICERMASYWRATGATPPAEPDHLGHLVTFYADLVEMQARETDDARRHAVGRLRKTVLWEHLLTWLPAYLTKVDLIAPRVYRRWSQLLWQAATREAWTVGPPNAVPGFLADLNALADPPQDDVHALVAHLSAPARCGLILVPVDVRRAADALQTPAPEGTLAAALAELIERRTAGMLEWLATEARRWETRHERNRDLLPALSDHWTRRARATRSLLHTGARPPHAEVQLAAVAGAAGHTSITAAPPRQPAGSGKGLS
jgi:TorA maturation chaperone TorD